MTFQIIQITIPFIIVFAQVPSFCSAIFFTSQAQSHSKQAAVMFSFTLYFHTNFSLPSSISSESSHLYIKALLLLSINSSVLILFLIGKVIAGIFCSTHSSHHSSQFPPGIIPLLAHFTRYP